MAPPQVEADPIHVEVTTIITAVADLVIPFTARQIAGDPVGENRRIRSLTRVGPNSIADPACACGTQCDHLIAG